MSYYSHISNYRARADNVTVGITLIVIIWNLISVRLCNCYKPIVSPTPKELVYLPTQAHRKRDSINLEELKKKP